MKFFEKIKKLNKKTLIIIGASVLCVLILGSVAAVLLINGNDKNHDKNAAVSAREIDPDNCKLNEFDGALIDYLLQNGYNFESFIISPTAMRAALCVSAEGAKGNTRTEIARAAGFSGTDALNAWYLGIDHGEGDDTDGEAQGDKFVVRTSVWCNKDILGEFTDSYLSDLTDNYGAYAYSHTSGELTQAIYDWMNQNTNGAIPAIAYDFTGASAAVINTVELKAVWLDAFDTAYTHDGTFTDIDGNERTMNFMEKTGEYLYADDNGTKIVVIPLQGDMSFVCFTGNRFGMFDKMTKLKKEKVRVVLPKFEMESSFDMSDISGFLLSRGVSDAIDEKKANFYNMCRGTNWYMQEIIQSIRINTDENGVRTNTSGTNTSAASASGDTAENEFVADAPFSFAVFSNLGTQDQHMLFYGQLMK